MKKLLLLLLISSAAIISCKKENKPGVVCTGDCITARGVLKQQGFTTYQYGSHILVDDNQSYVLTSNVVNLQKFEDKKVVIIAKNLHYTVENGPELHNVVYISLTP
jgi:hypothetical protein